MRPRRPASRPPWRGSAAGCRRRRSAGRARPRGGRHRVSPVRAASTISSCTLTLVRLSAANWAGSRPTRVGCTPLPSTRQGTSTQQPSGRLSISPWLGTLPLARDSWPVTMASMMTRAILGGCAPWARAGRRWSSGKGLFLAVDAIDQAAAGAAPAVPVILRAGEARHQLVFHHGGRLAEVGRVFAGVAAALGDEVAEVLEQLDAHRLLAAPGRVEHRFAQPGIEVLLAAAEFEEPGLVVDAGHAVDDLVIRHAHPARPASRWCPARCGTGPHAAGRSAHRRPSSWPPSGWCS